MNLSEEDVLYELLSGLPLEKQDEAFRRLDNEEDDALLNVRERLLNERARNKFYWELYYLVKDEDLTVLGEFYAYVFTGHYIKAFKKYLSFDESVRNKNSVLYKNPKANESLIHFGEFVSLNKDKVLSR